MVRQGGVIFTMLIDIQEQEIKTNRICVESLIPFLIEIQ